MSAKNHPDYPAEVRYLSTVRDSGQRALRRITKRDWVRLSDKTMQPIWQIWSAQRSAALVDALKKPYFGRIDMRTGDGRYYIGQSGMRDPDSNELLVIDWRAPLAGAFYQPGDEVGLRRRYVIEG